MRKRTKVLKPAIWTLISLAILSYSAFGQGARYDNFALTSATIGGVSGIVKTVPNASIRVCTYSLSPSVPCAVLATTYTDQTLGASCAGTTQVVLQGTNTCVSQADASGNFGFWAAAGIYTVQISGSGVTTQSIGVVVPLTSGVAGAIPVITNPSAPQTISGQPTYIQNLASQRLASAFAGGDCGAKINAADAALSSSTPGEILVDQSCGTTWTTAVATSTRHTLRFVQGGTYNISAIITLGQNSCMVGPPGSITDDSNTYPETGVILKQSNSTNLAEMVLASSNEGCIQDITLDGNRANNTTTVGVVVTGAHFHGFRVSITQMPSDGLQQTSTGTTNNAASMILRHVGISRNAGNAITCTGSADNRIDFSFFAFNGGYGYRGINCNSALIAYNEISVNTNGGIYLTGSSTSAILFAQHNLIAGNSFGNNQCGAGATVGGDIAINGFDGSSGGNVLETQIEYNRMVGGSATSNTCDSIHIADTTATNIVGNKIRSSAGFTWRYGVFIASVSSTEGRDIVEANTFDGTFGTGVHIGTSATNFELNDDNGSANFDEFDVASLFIPNNQAINGKQVGGTVVAAYTPYTNLNHSLFTNTGGLFDFVNNGTTGLQISASGIPTYAGLTTTGQGVPPIQATSGAITIGSGTSIGATSLCSTTQCPAGRYEVKVYIDITTACTTTGTYIPWLGWTDDQGAKAGSSTTTYFSAAGGLGVTPATATTGATLGLASTANFLTGVFFLSTTGVATGGLGSINYGTTATACGTGGPMVGKMYFDVLRLE